MIYLDSCFACPLSLFCGVELKEGISIYLFFLSESGNTHFSSVNANNPLLHPYSLGMENLKAIFLLERGGI